MQLYTASTAIDTITPEVGKIIGQSLSKMT